MKCKYCKDSGKLLLLNKYVECECTPKTKILTWDDTTVFAVKGSCFSRMISPPTPEDIANTQEQLSKVAMDPNLTVVTGFTVDRNITPEMWEFFGLNKRGE